MVNNLRNMVMMRNIQRKNSRFGGKIQEINDIGFAIFAIDDGGVQEKQVAKFIHCNKACCNILNVSEEDIIGKSVLAIMPEQIRNHHELFIRRFFHDGLNRLLGKVRNMYIRNFLGYIQPS